MLRHEAEANIDAVAILELLASDAPPDRFESLLTLARSAGMPGPQLDRLENARKLRMHIYSQLDRRQQREASLSALVDIARELSAPYDLKTLLKVTTRRARMLLGADISYITLLTAEKGAARVEASRGHVSSFHVGMQIPHGAGSSDVLTTSAPFWSADYLSDARFPHHERLDEMVRAEELRGIMAVPLSHGSGPFGVLHVADREPRHFSADEVSLMSSLGDLAGAVIEKAWLMDRTAAEMEMLQRRTDEAEAGHRQWQEVGDMNEFLMSQVLSGCDLQSLVESGVRRPRRGADRLRGRRHGAGHHRRGPARRRPHDLPGHDGRARRREGDPGQERGVGAAPVLMGDENLGALLLRTERPLWESGIRLLGLVAQATAVLLLMQNSHGIVMESQARDGFLDDLVNRTRSTRSWTRRRSFSNACGSPTHAAKELHVHPNTVARRLERVNELLGEGWQHPDRALEVQLAREAEADAVGPDGAGPARGWLPPRHRRGVNRPGGVPAPAQHAERTSSPARLRATTVCAAEARVTWRCQPAKERPV
ncbi:hypothetical protein SMICM304S_02332 [Streptomyces microflavus]